MMREPELPIACPNATAPLHKRRVNGGERVEYLEHAPVHVDLVRLDAQDLLHDPDDDRERLIDLEQ